MAMSVFLLLSLFLSCSLAFYVGMDGENRELGFGFPEFIPPEFPANGEQGGVGEVGGLIPGIPGVFELPPFPREEVPPRPEVPRQEPPVELPPKAEVPPKEVIPVPREKVPIPPTEEVPVPPKVVPVEPVPPREEVPAAPREEVPYPPKEEVPVAPREEVPYPPKEEVPVAPREEVPVPPREEVPRPREEAPVPPREEGPRFPGIPGVLPGGMIPIPKGLNVPLGEIGLSVLRPGFYRETCPNAESIVKRVLQQAVERDPRTAASLLRLQFHDCFVQGCDASILLDDAPGFQGEKTANPNLNSARGFEVIDEIKSALERECSGVVSCADILAIAARDSVVLTGGPSWEVLLGRRDSLTASKSLANRDIPPPNSTLPQLIAAFAKKGLTPTDMVVLSGSHTIGLSRCASFRQRLYNFQRTRRPDSTLEPSFLRQLQKVCPRKGNAQVTEVLDFATPAKFDNHYYINLQFRKGLLTSDQVLFAPGAALTNGLVTSLAENEAKFFQEFAASMVKMGNIKPLVGNEGQVRKECRFVNARK